MARIWVDCTNSPHVVIFRPLVAELQRRGHEVAITARDFAQTVGLLERYGMPYTLIGEHRGRSIANKVVGVWSRGRALARWAREQEGAGATPGAQGVSPERRLTEGSAERGGPPDSPQYGPESPPGGPGSPRGGAPRPRRPPFDLAVSHGSNDLPLAAKLLGIPHVTMFDYEHASLMHHFNIRMSARVIVPDAIPPSVLARYGLRPSQLRQYPGLKEEYYLADFEPDSRVLAELGLDPTKVLVTLRTPPSLAAYHRGQNPLFEEVLRHLAARSDVQQVVLARTPDQRAELLAMDLANARVPERTVDAASLVYYSDLVVSAGGTINREAVALGTPAFTVFEGRMGAVDLALIDQGRLTRLTSPDGLPLVKKPPARERVTRDPAAWVDLILGPPVLPFAAENHG